MEKLEELIVRLQTVAFLTSAAMQSVATYGSPNRDALEYSGILLEKEVQAIAHSLEVINEEISK